MKKYYWLLGGAIWIAVAFFIPGRTGEIWDSLLFANIAAVLYIIIFAAFWLKKINSSKVKVIITGALFCMTTLFVASALISYQQSLQQKANLMKIRLSIETQIAEAAINKALLHTIEEYYNRNNGNYKQSLAAIFYTKYDSLIDKNRIFHYNDNINTLIVYVKKATPDSVVLIAQSESIKGREASFKNYTGESGLFQSIGILTPAGITYDRKN